MDNLRLWHKFLQAIKPVVGPDNYKAWFLKTTLKSLTDEKITLSTPHAFIKETLQQKHLSLIETTFENLLGKKLPVEFIIKEAEIKVQEETDEDFFQPIQTATALINPKYTLANFVVGPSNNVAYAAAQAVVQNPGTSYNPLFLYGGTGVGKTHLMLGIGNALLAKNSHLKIIYCSSEKFMNDYVTAIQEHKMGYLRARYRMADILLIDDIQFFSGREGTQEEFFHTFNELQSRNSQMILTSDRVPQEIAKLEDRLKSRFVGGLMIDIQLPDFDTRVAILRAKCIEQGQLLPEDSLKLIASSLDSNIRELEGKLIQILQVLKAQNLSSDPENVAKFLGQSSRKPITTDHKQILSTICTFFNISLKDMTGPKRQKGLVLPRHIAMYLLSEELKLTVEKIGQVLGGRDHTTVMHGRDKMKKLIYTDREVQRMMVEVKQKING
ncbi:MAG: chromosomal replication initiator protein DnaA [Candidatus Daviesbacteria bacterium]|nr:chromosomal replication initiator protein DnaA [Candidatus Daviesbacteria bacterium]